MSFLMIVSLAYVTIETVDPEPALAASWDCLDSNGRPIAFQTEYSGGDLIVHRYNFSNGASLSQTTFSGSGFNGSGEINATFMDLDGNLYVQRKTSSSGNPDSRVYLVNPTGSPTQVSLPAGDNRTVGTDLNAATFFVDNGYEYAISAKGHFSSAGAFMRFSNDTTVVRDANFSLGDTNTGGGSIKRSKAKDFTWIRDNSSFPTMFNGLKPSFIGIDGGNQRIYVSSYSISNQGSSNESIEIETQSYSISIPSGDRSDFGAIYGFGGDNIYALNNSSGNIYKINVSGSGYSITDTSNNGASTTNNDGAACHAGDPDVTFAPTIPTPTQGSCDGSDRQINVVLNNSSSNVAANFVVTYTVNGGSSQSLTSGTSVSASSNGALTVPAQADNAQVLSLIHI